MQVNGSSAVHYLLLSLEIFQWQGHSSVIYRPWGRVHNPCVLSIDYGFGLPQDLRSLGVSIIVKLTNITLQVCYDFVLRDLIVSRH